MRSNRKARVDYDDLSPEGGYKIKTYYPTLEEMKDFSAYIKHIHDDNGHRAGLAKIVPPKEYVVRKAGYATEELYNMDITSPIKQEVSGESGLYQQLNLVEKSKMTVRKFKKTAEEKYSTPEWNSHEELERLFWKNVFTQPAIYGADVSGSLYDDDVQEFNLTKLNTILDNIGDDYGVTIQGVNTAYLYFGMWKTSFCWHTEDMDLYSINYLHEGAPKAWYCISPEHGRRFERLAASFFPHSFRTCKAFLRHKTTLISPQILKKYSIPYSKCLQEKGQFMITFPYSYHSGFNTGFNIAEATNFALEYWVDFGKWATRCECSSESVKISMQTFVKRYQPDRYENWLRGKDICEDPREPKHKGAAPKPTEYDLYLMGIHTREALEEEEAARKNTALQQIQSSNVKIKTKAARKVYPPLDSTSEKYNNVYLPERAFDSSNRLSLCSTNQQDQDNLQAYDQAHNFAIDLNDNKLMKEKLKKERQEEARKRKKEERLRLRREKRLKEMKVPSNELLQILPLTFTHEKRFNRCIAAQPPHCSVCQILELHPKGNERIWGSMKTTPSSIPPPNESTASKSETSMMTCQDTPSTCTDSQNLCNPSSLSTPTIVATAEAPPPLTPVSQPTLPVPVTAGPQVEEFKLPDSSPILLPRGVFNRDPKLPETDEQPTKRIVSGDTGGTITSNSAAISSYSSSKANTSDSSSLNVTQTSSQHSETCSMEAVDEVIDQGDSGYIADNDKLEFLDINLESSELLQCSVCMLCVHKTCYGVDKMPGNGADWICDRCLQPNRSLINCEFCPCRGGALKELVNTQSCQQWIHVTCALFIPELNFIDLIRQNKSALNKLKIADYPSGSEKMFCTYCASSTNLSRYVQGRCIQCIGYLDQKNVHYACPKSNSFHPNCAHRNGAKFDCIDFFIDPETSLPIQATCTVCLDLMKNQSNHAQAKKEVSQQQDALDVGDEVVAMASNTNFYKGKIASHRLVTYFDVFFPERNEIECGVMDTKIVDYNPEREFQVGDEIHIKSCKDEILQARFKSKQQVEEYVVDFCTPGSGNKGLERVSRRNIYLNEDQIPADLLKKYKGVPEKPEFVKSDKKRPTPELCHEMQDFDTIGKLEKSAAMS